MAEMAIDALIVGMDPELASEQYVYCSIPTGSEIPKGLRPFAVIDEQEARTMITTRGDAQLFGLTAAFPCRRITLKVHSSLSAVGFLARVASALAQKGISANCVSAFYHDHLFVPIERAEEALETLQQMQLSGISRFQPVTLTGQYVELRPLSWDHFEDLAELSDHESIWRWYNASGQSRDQLRSWLTGIFSEQERGVAVAFTTFDRASGRVAGCTRFMNIDAANLRVEIGGTWLAPVFQRTRINTEAKYLMFRHAFETWGCNRVEFKTDSLNERSRKAIARLGAKDEGTLRNHMVTYTGRIRHSVYFSVIAEEWPTVKAGLEARLAK